MLPLVANVQPASAPSAPSVVSEHAQSLPFSIVSDAAAAARQQLPIAVSTSGAPAAYHPDTLQSRQAASERQVDEQSRDQGAQTNEDAASAQQAARLAKLPAWAQRFINVPLMQRTPFSSLFAAQFLAQDVAGEEALQYFSPPQEESAPTASLPARRELPVHSSVRELIVSSYAHNASPRFAEKPLGKMPQALIELRYSPVARKPGLDRATGALAYALASNRSTQPSTTIEAA